MVWDEVIRREHTSVHDHRPPAAAASFSAAMANLDAAATKKTALLLRAQCLLDFRWWFQRKKCMLTARSQCFLHSSYFLRFADFSDVMCLVFFTAPATQDVPFKNFKSVMWVKSTTCSRFERHHKASKSMITHEMQHSCTIFNMLQKLQLVSKTCSCVFYSSGLF